MPPFGVLCGAVAAALTPFGTFWDPLGSLRSYLGRQRQLTLEAELWGHTKVLQPKQAN